MVLLVCIDAWDLDGILEEGREYLGELLPCHAVKVGNLVFARSRFEVAGSARDPFR